MEPNHMKPSSSWAMHRMLLSGKPSLVVSVRPMMVVCARSCTHIRAMHTARAVCGSMFLMLLGAVGFLPLRVFLACAHPCFHHVDNVVAQLFALADDVHVHRSDGVSVLMVVHIVDVLAL